MSDSKHERDLTLAERMKLFDTTNFTQLKAFCKYHEIIFSTSSEGHNIVIWRSDLPPHLEQRLQAVEALKGPYVK